MHHQFVRPAGADRETGWVSLVAVLIVAAAAAAVNLRPAARTAAALPVHHIDARTGLTAAEQGLYADLLVAAEEIAALNRMAGTAPTPEALATEGLPPFVADAVWRNRGALAWGAWEAGHATAYVGVTAEPTVAGSLLLLVDGHTGHGARVWLKRAAETPPATLDERSLVAAGWKRVVSNFAAGVTR